MMKVAAALGLVSVALAQDSSSATSSDSNSYGATGFSIYPNYNGSSRVPMGPGMITLAQALSGSNQAVTLNWKNLYGDPACDGSPSSVPNSCGVHIHWGTACEAGVVQGHMFNKDVLASDPWTQVRYVQGQGTKLQVETGFPVSVLVEQGVLLIHDKQGNRMACSQMASGIAPAPLFWQAGGFGVYPGYQGSVRISSGSGVLTASQALSGSNEAVKLVWGDLQGDPSCNGTLNDLPNSCGVHIHWGTSCAAGAVQGHLYNAGFLGPDPWKPVTYVQGQHGTALVETGYSMQTMAQQGVLIAHDKLGQRVACSMFAQP